jgi:hypothetical protein
MFVGEILRAELSSRMPPFDPEAMDCDWHLYRGGNFAYPRLHVLLVRAPEEGRKCVSMLWFRASKCKRAKCWHWSRARQEIG